MQVIKNNLKRKLHIKIEIEAKWKRIMEFGLRKYMLTCFIKSHQIMIIFSTMNATMGRNSYYKDTENA